MSDKETVDVEVIFCYCLQLSREGARYSRGGQDGFCSRDVAADHAPRVFFHTESCPRRSAFGDSGSGDHRHATARADRCGRRLLPLPVQRVPSPPVFALPPRRAVTRDAQISLTRQTPRERNAMFRCPECNADLAIGDCDITCVSCGFKGTPEEIAELVVRKVLGITEESIVKDGARDQLFWCVGCEQQALVDFGVPDGESENRYGCFACGATWNHGELELCERCEETLLKAGDSPCENCMPGMDD